MVDRTRREADGPAWHCLDAEETLTRLDTGPGGLGAGEAARRLAQHGPNELADRGARHPARLFLEQFTSLMVVILLGAAGLSVALGKLLEAGAILAIVFLFAVLGFVQEYRAGGHRCPQAAGGPLGARHPGQAPASDLGGGAGARRPGFA